MRTSANPSVSRPPGMVSRRRAAAARSPQLLRAVALGVEHLRPLVAVPVPLARDARPERSQARLLGGGEQPAVARQLVAGGAAERLEVCRRGLVPPVALAEQDHRRPPSSRRRPSACGKPPSAWLDAMQTTRSHRPAGGSSATRRSRPGDGLPRPLDQLGVGCRSRPPSISQRARDPAQSLRRARRPRPARAPAGEVRAGRSPRRDPPRRAGCRASDRRGRCARRRRGPPGHRTFRAVAASDPRRLLPVVLRRGRLVLLEPGVGPAGPVRARARLLHRLPDAARPRQLQHPARRPIRASASSSARSGARTSPATASTR